MGTPSTDTASWTGWAISSFTNKLAAASGDIQPNASKTNGNTPTIPSLNRSTSSPATPSLDFTSRPTSSASNLARLALTSSATTSGPNPARVSSIPPIRTPAYTDTTSTTIDDQDTGFDDAWGDMPDENEDGASFFDALGETPNSTNPNITSTFTKPAASPTPFDDGGEPDFAGWLSAQRVAKTKPPLPKGLNKGLAAMKSPAGNASGGGVNRKGIPTRPAEIKKSVT
ncbi:MAG: hypothetical protein LQ340_006307, partial [Diploschistes diacapsis]